MTLDAYRRIIYTGGQTLNLRTVEMLIAAERRCGFELVITQGSYNAGITQSAGTHDGGGALDVRARDLTSTQRKTVETELRRVGFAAWIRDPSQGDWPYHVHGIAVGDREMSPEAAQQVTAYNNGRNGLASNGPDTGTDAFVGTVYPQELDVSFYGPANWDSADWDKFKNYAGWGFNIEDLNAGDGTMRDASKLLSYIHKNGADAEREAIAAKDAAVSASNQAAAAQTAAGKAEQSADEALQATKDLEARLFPPA